MEAINKEGRARKKLCKELGITNKQLRKICHQERWVEWPKVADPQKAEKKIIVKGYKS